MSEPSEGATVSSDQIYAELRALRDTLIELKVRFEIVSSLEKRVEALEAAQRGQWQLPVAWTSAVAGTVAAVYQAVAQATGKA